MEAPDRLIDWGAAVLPLPGEMDSGDRHLVARIPHGVLLAVVDGLGHGPEATEAARLAVATLEGFPHEPVDSLIARCHQELRRTRGAVISLATIDSREATMTWIGVGNAEAVLLRADPEVRRDPDLRTGPEPRTDPEVRINRGLRATPESRSNPQPRPRLEWLFLRGGVVGYVLPPLRPATLPLHAGDTLCMATDGIRSGFVAELNIHEPPQRMADRILDRWSSGIDDALVLVVRYLSDRP